MLVGVATVVFTGTSEGPREAGSCARGDCARPVRTAVPTATQVAYRTVERDRGYFEGTVTIVNHGAAPMASWILSFTYPGADIRNAWEGRLQRPGQDVVLSAATGAEPIRPGGSREIRFGGAGTSSMPTNCRLNDAPCAFVGG